MPSLRSWKVRVKPFMKSTLPCFWWTMPRMELAMPVQSSARTPITTVKGSFFSPSSSSWTTTFFLEFS